MRDEIEEEIDELAALLARLYLYELTYGLERLAAQFGAMYRLRAADAVHLATADAHADRFITNNTKDFPKSIGEVEIVYPVDLPESK